MMTSGFRASSSPPVERLAIVESDALEDRSPLLVSSSQRLLAQGSDESLEAFSSRLVERVTGMPSARAGLLVLGEESDFETRWCTLLAVASRLQGVESAELVISVRSGSPSETVGWQLLEQASHRAFFRGINLRLQLGKRPSPQAASL